MKKIVLVLMTLSLLVACNSTQTAASPSPAKKKVIKGNWTLNTITYSEDAEFNVTLLNEATKECFEGSAWNFIPNNNTGSYSIEGDAECHNGIRNFIFTVDGQNFLLKPTDARGKSLTNSGFRFNLVSMSETSLTLAQTVNVEEEENSLTITWQFSR
ncbi:lipocalin family protein [Tamlana agarivorans]|uniref:Lipocalin family protein n=1 Tax=Pseudotamlana agarivorans TaxID=481183 RepID=A0ACC5U648_9FLAO|nr:lipocalin family protein [Tamlana agarivorans]MBU2949803.1 lipocalin family protein [Tamlana agarivorans]